MQVKKFEAPTLQEALEVVKRELGPEAIILQTKKYKRGFGLMSNGSIEVTAAVSERSLNKKAYVESRVPAERHEDLKKLPANRQAEFFDDYVEKQLGKAAIKTQDRVEIRSSGSDARPRVKTAVRYAEIEDDSSVRQRPMATTAAPIPAPSAAASGALQLPIEEEVKNLRKLLEDLKSAQEAPAGAGAQALIPSESLATSALQDAYEQIVIAGVDKRYAHALIKQVAFEIGAERAKRSEEVLDQLAVEILHSTEVLQLFDGVEVRRENGGTLDSEGPVVFAMVGPTGAGKTTTSAKLAAYAQKVKGLKVGLLNVDYSKATAFDQAATYAKIFNLPFRSAASVEDLEAAIQDFQSLDLVIVDTSGRSQKDPQALQEIQSMLKSIPRMQACLVLSATTRDADLYDMVGRFSLFKPLGIIMSKLDEASVYGAVYNVPQKVKLPLLFFTTGQKVPDDLEEATRERVVSLIMEL